MPEIELVPVRRFRRRTRRAVAAVGIALGAGVVGSLVIVALPGGDEPAGPFRVAPVSPGAPAPGAPSPEPATALETVEAPAADARAVTAQADISQDGTPQAATDVAVGSTATHGPTGPTDGPTEGPTDGPLADSTEPTVDPAGPQPADRAPRPDRGRDRFSGALDPAQQLLLDTVRSTAPGFAPLVGGLFDTTDGLLDDVDDGLPVRQGASKR